MTSAITLDLEGCRLAEQDTPSVDVELHSVTCHNTLEDIEHMKKILEEDPTLINSKMKTNSMFKIALPLHDAAFRLHDKCVEFLLSRGADINALCGVRGNVTPNCSAMQCAITSSFNRKSMLQYNVIKSLLDHGSSPNNIFNLDFKNTFFIDHCILFHMNDILKLLLDYGADTHVEQNIHSKVDLGTPLAKCILSWNAEGLKLLLLNNAKDMVFNYEMMHPLNETIFNWTITSVVHMIAIESGFQHLKAYDDKKEQDNILEMALKFFKIYKSFKGSLWELQNQSSCDMCNENIYENVIRYLNYHTHFKSEYGELFIKTLKELMYNPPSLKSLARIAVQESMDQSYLKNIHKLEIPETLKEYLFHNELDTTQVGSIRALTITQVTIDDIIEQIMNENPEMFYEFLQVDLEEDESEEAEDEIED